jgi:hypothetical protein
LRFQKVLTFVGSSSLLRSHHNRHVISDHLSHTQVHKIQRVVFGAWRLISCVFEYKGGLEGSAGAVPGEELDIVANPPKSSISSSEQPPQRITEEKTDSSSLKTVYGTYSEKLSGSQRLVALAFVVAIIYVIYRSRKASRARAVFQEKTMA